MLLAAGAVRGGKKSPAVGGDLEGVLQGGQSGVQMPCFVDMGTGGGGLEARGHLSQAFLPICQAGALPIQKS